MLNVFQISEEIDSVKRNADNIQKNFLVAMKADHPYFESLNFKPVEGVDELNSRPKKESAVYFDSLNDQDKLIAVQNAQSWIRRKNQNLKGQEDYLEGINNDLDGYWIEFHRKFALTYAIIVLFFIGAPLGAIVRKGGFGAPVVIAALLFMIYFVLISVGDSLANSGVVSPFLGMWFASIVLTPIAIILLRAAANDSPVFNKETWTKFFRFKLKKA